MTVRRTIKLYRRAQIETYRPELRQPWLTESFAIIVAALYVFWLKLWSR
jgi:hypothetical protein